MPRLNSTPIPIVEGHPLNLSAQNTLLDQIPVGPGAGAWWKLLMRIRLPLTATTASGAKPDAGLSIVDAYTFETSRKEKPMDKVPGRVLYQDMILKGGVQEPHTDLVAPLSATYDVFLEHWFIDPRMRAPLDTVFDAARYKWAKIVFGLGGVSDLFDTVGDAAIAAPTLDVWAFKIDGELPAGIARAHRELIVYPPADPDERLYIDPERDEDFELKRLHILATENATGGVPFSGNLSDAVLDAVALNRITAKGSEALWPEMGADFIRRHNQTAYQLESMRTGAHVLDFVEAEGSHLRNVKPVGSKFRLDFSAQEGSTNPQITAVGEGIRRFR